MKYVLKKVGNLQKDESDDDSSEMSEESMRLQRASVSPSPPALLKERVKKA